MTHVETGAPRHQADALAKYWRSVRELPREPPKAVLIISAHWEERVPTVMTSPKPPLLFDYGGFAPEAYRLTWPVPGSPSLAARVRELLAVAGFESSEDPTRGFDHGAFTPLKQTYPEADVPALQLSLKEGLDAAEHLAIGRALGPLRDEGVFIVGSGDTFHNLRQILQGGGLDKLQQFDAWLRTTVTDAAAERDQRLTHWASAPFARFCHPREEHLLPLLVAAGAAGADTGVVTWSGEFLSSIQTGFHFG